MFKGTKGLFIMLGGVILFILLLGLFTQNERGQKNILSNLLPSKGTTAPTGLTNLKPITIGNTVVMVQVANTPQTREQGLSGIVSLPQDQGMLFDFGRKNIFPQNARFWMKGMKIPLDFIWITNNKVVEITPNVPNPAPNTSDSSLPIYAPSESIDFVLEVNAGFATKTGVKVGDIISNLP